MVFSLVAKKTSPNIHTHILVAILVECGLRLASILSLLLIRL